MRIEMIKSPLNYTGGKYKLLPQILPYFPSNINTFVDMFCGGLNVSANVKCKKIIANDLDEHVIGIYESLKEYDIETIESWIRTWLKMYELSDSNEEMYYKLRAHYNDCIKLNKNSILHDMNIMLFVLVCHSFNNMIRFNKKGDFNVPFGKRTYNPNMRKNLVDFYNAIHNIDITFSSEDFRKLDLQGLSKDDFVYCDPPYSITCAAYNSGWDGKDDKDLMDLLDKLHEDGIRFALSNVFSNKGKVNKQLIKWSKKYNVYHLNASYSNCSYHKNNVNKTDEVLITNY